MMNINTQGTLFKTYNTYYLSGLPGMPHLIRNVKLKLFSEGFLLEGKRFARLWIPHNSIFGFKLFANKGCTWTHASRSGNLLEKLIAIDYCDQHRQTVSITLEMVVSIFSGLPNYRACKELVQLIELNKISDKFSLIQPIPSNSNATILTQIEKLNELHKSGALTDAEFESKKTELLKRI